MATKKEQIAREVAHAVDAGKAVVMETVDFSDPNRPKTCLEVDFPLIPINQIAAVESSSGAATKPVYQMAKWWARRPSSVFRSLLIAAATKATDDQSEVARHIWDNYYANFRKKGSLKHLNVLDIFMGGGTTLVEGARLGMRMSGNDLNPVAWFVVKQELADVDLDEVKRLLADIEAEVRPQIMPFYYCDGPNGEKGTWTYKPTGEVMGPEFDPLALKPEERKDYSYQGPEIIYTFWAKHGPCQVTGCGHRTPIMTKPEMALKSISVKSWAHTCHACATEFDIEADEARLAPDVALYVAPGEKPYTILDPRGRVVCPNCGHTEMVKLDKGKNKKVELSLLVHPEWLKGSPRQDRDGNDYGGSAKDDVAPTIRWNTERAKHLRLVEVRGNLPEKVTCPETGVTFSTGNKGGTVPKKSTFTCQSDGRENDVLDAIKASGRTGPMAGYAVQAFSPIRKESGALYGGRYFLPFDQKAAKQYNASLNEWEERKEKDLASYWPRSELPYGFMTHHLQGGVPNHGFTHWWTMFNPRQLLVQSQILKSIVETGDYNWATREYVLGAFQQFLRFNCMFTVYHPKNDQATKHFANNNFHPRNTLLEVSVFSPVGDGRWVSAAKAIIDGAEWKAAPWDLVPSEQIEKAIEVSGKTEKVFTRDCPSEDGINLSCGSSSDLNQIADNSVDLVVTDPPFGGLVHYSELSDFFYVWLRLALKGKYPEYFNAEYTPKSLEAVTNIAREGDEADAFYQRLLTQCWKEAYRTLKSGGLLAFTFHHSEDEPWVAVLESLFDSGFYLEAAYPIRADTSSDTGQFGSKTIEYDIIHVCRKRTEEPKSVSWARMRREVFADVRQIQGLLENHARCGLPEADIQVIRRGKALEYFSQHYGKVYVDEGRPISVKDALVGINQLIDEDANRASEPPPVSAEPITRQFLRIFDGKIEIARDQMQKVLRGSGIAPDEFVNRGWVREERKVFHLNDPLEIARDWQGRHRRRLSADLDQTFVLMGACYDGSGINAVETLKNENFKPHAALKSLLEWMSKRGQTQQMRNAASRAVSIYNNWAASNKEQVQQLSFFLED